MSQEFSGSPPALMVGGPRVSSGGTERGGNNTRLYTALPRGQGFFPSRGPQVRGPPHIPIVRSGVMMELLPGNTRMAGKERLAHVSFRPGGQPPAPRGELAKASPLVFWYSQFTVSPSCSLFYISSTSEFQSISCYAYCFCSTPDIWISTTFLLCQFSFLEHAGSCTLKQREQLMTKKGGE